MLILTIRTDNPQAEIGLFNDNTELVYKTWHAHYELSKDIHQKIQDILQEHGKTNEDIAGIVAFQGPGSFTGLRIGLTVANSLAYGLEVPIVGAMGEDWIRQGIGHLRAGEKDHVALPHYGAPAHITQQKK